jgi:uracil-DNA glycosylase
MKNNLKIKSSVTWESIIHEERGKPYFASLMSFVSDERQKYDVYPPENMVFNAFALTPLERVRVVIIGQDPYHGEGEAHGLSFSVPEGVAIPPSLRNIFKELNSDTGKDIPDNGNLESWARQGVLLLNATLTVRKDTPGSHQKKGWEEFTDTVIRMISHERDNVVFILWGRFAQSKEQLIDASRHHVLVSVHPSPLSAHRGFFGCGHFSRANTILSEMGEEPVKW